MDPRQPGGLSDEYGAVMDGLLVRCAVLQLPRHERARVAEQLLASLEEAEEQVAVAWARELERRSREIAEGKVQTVEWDTVRAEVLKELERRREGPTPP